MAEHNCKCDLCGCQQSDNYDIKTSSSSSSSLRSVSEVCAGHFITSAALEMVLVAQRSQSQLNAGRLQFNYFSSTNSRRKLDLRRTAASGKVVQSYEARDARPGPFLALHEVSPLGNIIICSRALGPSRLLVRVSSSHSSCFCSCFSINFTSTLKSHSAQLNESAAAQLHSASAPFSRRHSSLWLWLSLGHTYY